jgi:predicted NBD/HSP70 family sugar kinase
MPIQNVLVVDVGGTHVKVGTSGRKDIVKIESSPTMTPASMVADVKKSTACTDGLSLNLTI